MGTFLIDKLPLDCTLLTGYVLGTVTLVLILILIDYRLATYVPKYVPSETGVPHRYKDAPFLRARSSRRAPGQCFNAVMLR